MCKSLPGVMISIVSCFKEGRSLMCVCACAHVCGRLKEDGEEGSYWPQHPWHPAKEVAQKQKEST